MEEKMPAVFVWSLARLERNSIFWFGYGEMEDNESAILVFFRKMMYYFHCNSISKRKEV